jgi:hypothetical protein
MIKFLVLAVAAILFVPGVMPAQTAKKAGTVRKPAVKAVVIPKDAVALGGQKWRWTDAKGKKWIFTRTPFSIVKTEESAVAAGDSESTPSNRLSGATIIDEGDTLKFVTKTPFGTNEWRKKKSDLTEEERDAWESRNAKPQVAATPKSE